MPSLSQWNLPYTAQSSFNMPDEEQAIADIVFKHHGDPLGFVMAAYPWGERGPLEKYKGPDTWQKELLIELGEAIRNRHFDGVTPVMPIRITRSSGHGIGKGVATAMIVDFLMSTRPGAIGTITANSYGQLETKTWAAIQKWTKLCLTAHWFTVTGNMMFKTEMREQWFTAAISCAPENAQAFAGQHNATSTSFYIFDEGSNVDDKIYDIADGGLTDGEPMIFVFGNPSRSAGKFYRINFGEERKRWNHKAIDARTCLYGNKELQAEWLEDWGEDSDRYRVQVKGLPPQASDLQFISTKLVVEAQRRPPVVLRNDPIIGGLDVSRGGLDDCVFRFRRGFDARSIPTFRLSGESVRDSTILENKAIDVLTNGVWWTDPHTGQKIKLPVAMLFIDGTGVGGPVADHLRNLGYEKRVTEIQFGWTAPNTEGHEACGNMRTWMWSLMREALGRMAIDTTSDLEMDLVAPMYHYNAKNELMLESKQEIKKRLGTAVSGASPDDGDALALTFARPVAPRNMVDVAEIDDEDEYDEGMGFNQPLGGGRVWA